MATSVTHTELHAQENFKNSPEDRGYPKNGSTNGTSDTQAKFYTLVK